MAAKEWQDKSQHMLALASNYAQVQQQDTRASRTPRKNESSRGGTLAHRGNTLLMLI